MTRQTSLFVETLWRQWCDETAISGELVHFPFKLVRQFTPSRREITVNSVSSITLGSDENSSGARDARASRCVRRFVTLECCDGNVKIVT